MWAGMHGATRPPHIALTSSARSGPSVKRKSKSISYLLATKASKMAINLNWENYTTQPQQQRQRRAEILIIYSKVDGYKGKAKQKKHNNINTTK